MKLSIVIPTMNRRELIARTLPTVLNQNLPPGEYEVVVVSDGSTDGTVDFIRSLKTPVQLRVIDGPHQGLAATRNAGIQAARSELVLLLDDDMVGEPTLVGRHIAAHSTDSSCIAVGSLQTSPESRTGLATDLVRASHQGYHDGLTRRGPDGSEYRLWLANNISAPRSLLLAHQGYDERFLYCEDHELAIRLWEAGVRLKFLPHATVYEVYSKTTDDMVTSDAPRLGAAEVKLTRKHPGYRGASVPASILGESRKKLLAWWVCCGLPVSPDVMLRIPCWIAERLSESARMQRFGIRVLQYRKSIAVMRSAMCEVGSWQELRREFGMRLPVLRYAQMGSVKRFEADVRWLAQRGYVGIAPSDWLAWVRASAALPERPVLITFDGAYAEVAEWALPVLRRHGFRAAIYVVTGRIGGDSEWDRKSGLAPKPLMTTDQIRYWAGEGIEFGAHSRSHRRLTELDTESLADEVEGSATDLTQLLDRRPAWFAYPYGAVNQVVLEQVKRSFQMAFGAAPGLNALSTSLYLMRTIAIVPSHRMLNLAFAILSGCSTILPRRSNNSFDSSVTLEQMPGSISRKVEI